MAISEATDCGAVKLHCVVLDLINPFFLFVQQCKPKMLKLCVTPQHLHLKTIKTQENIETRVSLQPAGRHAHNDNVYILVFSRCRVGLACSMLIFAAVWH